MLLFKKCFHIIVLVILFFSTGLRAEGIDVELNNNEAVLNEQVVATVKIATESDVEPKLKVDAVNADILQQEFQGLSTSTVYANGELTSKREYIYSVILQPKSTGRAGLTNISAEVGGRILKHDSVWFSVNNERQEQAPVLVIAQPSKTRVYQNEPILLRYYLLTEVGLAAADIKEFPKLNNFVKRYLQEQGNRERVAYQGHQYIRQLLYSVVLFPEKAKVLKIDPIKVQVAYDLDQDRDPFGFSGGRVVTKVLTSKPFDIEVVNLPSNTMPTGFTGLVGKHKFSLSVNKNKVLVNEPVELKLKVTGVGNLEGMDPPELIKDQSFESFETNSTLDLIDSTTAAKTFEYTYLPRKEAKIPAQKIPLSYFNPDTGQYETEEVDLPALEVAGGLYQNQPVNQPQAQQSNAEGAANVTTAKQVNVIQAPSMSGPIFQRQSEELPIDKILNVSVLILICILLALNFYRIREDMPWNVKSEFAKQYEDIANKGLNYAGLEAMLLHFPRGDRQHIPLRNKINDLSLPPKTKAHLLQLVDQLDNSYAQNAGGLPKVSWKEYKDDLKKLVKVLEEWSRGQIV